MLMFLLIVGIAAIGFIIAKSRSRDSARRAGREARRTVIRPLFRDEYAEFFRNLGVPLLGENSISFPEATTIGHHIFLHIADRDEEAQALVTHLCEAGGDAVVNAFYETELHELGPVRSAAFRAINAIASHSPPRPFGAIDLKRVRSMLVEGDAPSYDYAPRHWPTSQGLSWASST